MNRQVFRKEALERLSSPEQLDLLMPVTSGRGWLALAGVGLLLAMGLVWAIFGTVETTVDGTGVLVRDVGLEWIAAPHDGQVVQVRVAADSSVQPGDVLFTISPSAAGGLGAAGATEVRSERAGRVLRVNVAAGGTVRQGDPLVSIESPEAPLAAVVYVAMGEGFKIQGGMPVKTLPATATKQGDAYLPGTVASSARFPATRDEMMHSLQNEQWVDSLLALGPTVEVVVELSPERPLEAIYSGTPCQASIVVSKQHPIEFLLPTGGD